MPTATPDNPTFALSGTPVAVLRSAALAPSRKVDDGGRPTHRRITTNKVVGRKDDGSPVFEERELPVEIHRKEVAKVGNWTHRGTGHPVVITAERAKAWADNTAALLAAGVKPYCPNRHRFDIDPESDKPIASGDNYGHVLGVAVEGDSFVAEYALVGEDAIRANATNDVSICIVDGMRDAHGNVYGEALQHLAIVHNPALPNLAPSVRVAASGDAPAVDVAVWTTAPEAQPVTPPAAPSRFSLALGRPSRLALALAGTFTESKHRRDHGRFARALGAASVPTPGVDRPGPDPAAGFGGGTAEHPAIRAVLDRADRVAGQGGASGPQVSNLARSHYATDAAARAAFPDREAFASAAREAHEARSGVARAKTADLPHRPTGSLVTEGRALRAKADKTPAEHARLKAIGAEIDARGQSPRDWWETPENRARHRAYRAGMRAGSAWPAGTTANGVALAADAALAGLRGRLAEMLAGRRGPSRLALALCGGGTRPAGRLALALSGMADSGWRTIHGVHVHIGEDGKIDKGPAKFVGTNPSEHGHDGRPDGTTSPAAGPKTETKTKAGKTANSLISSDSKGFGAEQYRAASGIIDAVHQMPDDLKSLPVKTTKSIKTHGEYELDGRKNPVAFHLSESTPLPLTTAAHEMGHHLDRTLGFNGFDSESGDKGTDTFPVLKAIASSGAAAELKAIRKDKKRFVPKDVDELTQGREMFARAYSQYVADRSGHPAMRAEITAVRAKGRLSAASQWADDDFAPIAKAFDEMFAKKGLR